MRRRSFSPAPDPIAARLLALALDRGAQLATARTAASLALGLPLDGVGLVVAGHAPLPVGLRPGAVRGLAAADALALARRCRLDLAPGEPGFWPVVVFDRGEACLCWLSEAPEARGAA